ncbi:glycoside hydrolase family 3 protein [Robiginitalea marina]|uniref:beta-N-acetylhexosaminidase n=1 Tax=Robiginitalea marina TaxID=2954105 RepID=A0ABT1B0R9_9FLAO|nr:glycoside hydrolase family 3 N-terminal domain-containing protein [Robiginitalea marina]MCO5725430.1 glycoside hydrolase family 3 protein [Robiginitalea marina]
MPELPTYTTASSTLPRATRVGQLFMPAAYIHDSEEEIESLESLVRNRQVGGLCFFHSRASVATNFGKPRGTVSQADSLSRLKDLITRYQEAAEIPLLIAVDAEWGLGMRVEDAPSYPYALSLGALPGPFPELLYQLGLRMAQDCREAGVHWNLAPVVDINTNPANPVIGYRAFGCDARAVITRALPLLEGFRDGGVLSCLKHFPGHGDTAVDSHLDLPVLEKGIASLWQEELLPFREAIRAGAPAVMTGHLSLPHLDPSGLPASLSAPIIGLLRNDLGFDGVIITDAMNMKALGRVEQNPVNLNLMAFEAGNDLLCFASQVPESIERILERADPEQIEASFKRIWALKERLFLEARPPETPSWTPRSLNLEFGLNCLCEIGLNPGVLKRFRTEGFSLLYVGERPTPFIEGLKRAMDFEQQPWGAGNEPEGDPALPAGSNILLTIQPPSMKPSGNFGLSPNLGAAIDALAQKKNVFLYLFGNPYLLRDLPLDRLRGAICTHQPLKEFMEIAASHFLGQTSVQGRLPISLEPR